MDIFDKLRDDIGRECIDAGGFTKEQVEILGKFMDMAKDSYVIVQWPESQNLMEEEWFRDECILDVEGKFGDSAYFVPLKRMMEL